MEISITKKDFLPGDRWIYFKFYCGYKTGDRIIEEILGPVSLELINAGLIDKWFFIRYADPDNHLRWRVLLSDLKYFQDVILKVNKIVEVYYKRRQIYRYQIDTYFREISRYGSNSIDIIESIFWKNSVAIYLFLKSYRANSFDNLRWQFGLILVDKILTCFSLDIERKLEFVKYMRGKYRLEFNYDETMKKRIGDFYREEKNSIYNCLRVDLDKIEYTDLNIVRIIAENYRVEMQIYCENILHLENDNTLAISLNEIISSLIHMSINRLFYLNQRFQEYVLYELLSNYYTSYKFVNSSNSRTNQYH